jgi:hypothetical protein
MAVSPLGQLFRSLAPERIEGDVTISYSQFAMWSSCPQKWKLTYVDKNKIYRPTIHTVFGTSMHETLQYYIHTMYTKSVKEADSLDLMECLQEQLTQNYMVAVSDNNGEHFSTSKELQEFYEDGVQILDWFRKHRSSYFKSKGYELIGIEMPLYVQASAYNEKVKMNGFLDIVIRDTELDRILIIDIKTSTRGWKERDKQDKAKTSQLVLYKSYYAKQYGYDEEKIDILYFIVKRKLIEGFMYPQKRAQEFVPASGKPTRRKLVSEVENFVKTVFDAEGNYKTDIAYPAVANAGMSNCRYCEFRDREDLCPKANRIK